MAENKTVICGSKDGIPVGDKRKGQCPHLLPGLVDSGEGGNGEAADIDVVKPDHGDVIRDFEAVLR